jgi:PAS domain S-box-containing protein
MNNPLRRNFRVRLTFMALLASVPAMLAAHEAVSYVAAELLRAGARRQLATTTDTLSRNVRQWDRSVALALRVLAADPDVFGMDPARQRTALARTARVYDRVFLAHTTNLAGTNVARSDGHAPIDYSDREWFQRARNGQPVSRSVHVSRTTGRPAVSFSAPIREDARGRIVGVVGLVTHLDDLGEVIRAVRLGETGYAFIVDDHGQLLAHPDQAPLAGLRSLSQYPPVQALLRGYGSGSGAFTDASGEQWMTHTVALPNGWGVVSLQKESEVVGGASAFLGLAHWAVAGALLAIVIVTWLMSGRLMRPIRELTGAASALAAGRWDQAVPADGGDEVAELARSFNGMVGRLRAGYEDIEERVRERTARIRELNDVLVGLSRQGAGDGPDVQDALRRITETAVRTMPVARASVWMIDEARTRIWCLDLCESVTGRHTCGVELARAAYPKYFAALEEYRTIAAGDAFTDPRTAEFGASYLRPLGIGAMLDAPVWVRGRVVGVICHEHVGGPRAWTAEEVHFADCLANVVATVIESSERQRAESAQRESEARYRLVSRATNDVVWDWLVAGRSLYWNDALRRVFGYAGPAEAYDLDWWAARVHADDREAIVRGLHAAVADGGPELWTAEYRFRRSDGTYATVLDRGLVARDAAGRAVRMIGSMLDITERKRAEEVERERAALARAVESMDQVLGVVGPELRTPLAGLRAMSEFLLTDGAAQAQEFDQFVEGIHDEVVRMSGTVHNLLEAARLNSGKARWNWSRFALAEVCGDAVGGVRREVEARRVALTLTVEPPDLCMNGDADAVRRLVLNLLSNAHKHTAAGRIEVVVSAADNDADSAGSAMAPPRAIRVVVRDTGSGIRPEVRARLGQAFALNSGMVGKAFVTGTGLGVAICKGIVVAHGGSIEIESDPGRGTEVTAILRADLARAASEEDAGAGDPAAIDFEGVAAT